MLHQGIRVRDIATNAEVEAGQRARPDARPRDHAEGRGSRGAGRCRGGATATPAEPEVIKKGKKEEDGGEKKDEKKKDEKKK